MIKNIRDAVNTKMYKEKFNHYSTKLSSHKNPQEMWQTLNTIFPKTNTHSVVIHQICQRQSSTSFLYQLQGIYAMSFKTAPFLKF